MLNKLETFDHVYKGGDTGWLARCYCMLTHLVSPPDPEAQSRAGSARRASDSASSDSATRKRHGAQALGLVYRRMGITLAEAREGISMTWDAWRDRRAGGRGLARRHTGPRRQGLSCPASFPLLSPSLVYITAVSSLSAGAFPMLLWPDPQLPLSMSAAAIAAQDVLLQSVAVHALPAAPDKVRQVSCL